MIAILFLFYVAAALNSRECHAQNDTDAWKFIQAFNRGYLAYTTEKDTSYQCFTLARQSVDIANKLAVYAASFQLGANLARINVTQVASIGDTPDTIHLYFRRNGTPKELDVKVLYSDYKSCYISSNPHGVPACRMWIFSSAKGQDVESCLNRLKSQCNADITDVYDEERCGAPN